jgi:hypothetical protein
LDLEEIQFLTLLVKGLGQHRTSRL